MLHIYLHLPIDTGRKLNVHKTFRGRPGRLLSVLSRFNLCPVSTGLILLCKNCEVGRNNEFYTRYQV